MKEAKRFLAFVSLLLFTCTFAPCLRAQTASSGALTVEVSDPSGAVIPNASVTVSNTATGQSRTEVTGSDGSFTFPLLPVGNYTVTISAAGFSTATVASVAINVTETHVLNQSLAVGSQTQSVEVHTETQAVQTETSTLGGVVNNNSINGLPLVSRNYTQVLSLSPGATSDVVNASKLGHGTADIYVNGNANTE